MAMCVSIYVNYYVHIPIRLFDRRIDCKKKDYIYGKCTQNDLISLHAGHCEWNS